VKRSASSLFYGEVLRFDKSWGKSFANEQQVLNAAGDVGLTIQNPTDSWVLDVLTLFICWINCFSV